MRFFLAILLLLLIAWAPACKQTTGGALPKASSGNTPAGEGAGDEPEISTSSYIQTETRTPIEYTGSSD